MQGRLGWAHLVPQREDWGGGQSGRVTATLTIGGANEVQGLTYQADERDPGRHQGAEALCLGEEFSGAGGADPEGRAPAGVENRLLACPLHFHLDLHPLPGEDLTSKTRGD